jgi:hypothetical protein
MDDEPILEYHGPIGKRGWTRLDYADVLIRILVVLGIVVMFAMSIFIVTMELWPANPS